MILTLADDVRVILIKIADRLHNMRTLASMPEHKQVKIASETLYIYAPFGSPHGITCHQNRARRPQYEIRTSRRI